MQKAGLAPKGDNGYLQTFTVREGKEPGEATRLSINNDKFTPGEQFVPLPFSAEKAAKGEVLPDVKEPDNIWLIDVQDMELNPHAPPLPQYQRKAAEAAKEGASGVIFFNGKEDIQSIANWLDENPKQLAIPAIWVNGAISKKLKSDDANGFQINLEVAFKAAKRTGTNVIGYIDNGAPKTIILGAHYDHLGYGEDHNSLSTGEKAIHNGADDNASGTAALLELGRQLKSARFRNNNFILVAFSGEELGLFGSKYFTAHAPISMAQVNFMINMDMVGPPGRRQRITGGRHRHLTAMDRHPGRISPGRAEAQLRLFGCRPLRSYLLLPGTDTGTVFLHRYAQRLSQTQ